EIMVRAHLAAVDGIDFAHLLLDEGMARLAHHRRATMALYDIDRVPGQPWIVDDAGARRCLEKRLRKQSDQVVPLDELTVLVEKEAPIVIAVPGESHVRTRTPNDIRSRGTILLEHRVRNTVRERAIGFMVHLDELERQMRFELVDNETGATVSRINHNL